MYSCPIYIASDHAGYHLKKRLVRYLENELKMEVKDIGPHEYVETDDYPDFIIPLAETVAKTNGRGIGICANGVGVCITANKIPGIRAGIGYNLMAAETMMTDDNTNVLCLAAKLSTEEHAMAIVKKWLETEPSEHERHVRRRAKVAALDNDDNFLGVPEVNEQIVEPGYTSIINAKKLGYPRGIPPEVFLKAFQELRNEEKQKYGSRKKPLKKTSRLH